MNNAMPPKRGAAAWLSFDTRHTKHAKAGNAPSTTPNLCPAMVALTVYPIVSLMHRINMNSYCNPASTLDDVKLTTEGP